MQKKRPNCKNICFSPPLCILHEIYSNMPGKILFMEPITLLSGKFFQNKREHIDRFIDQLLHMADIFLRKRYGLNTFLEYFLQKADMDLCVLTLEDLISIGMILAFDAIRKSISQFNRDISAARMHLYRTLLLHRDYFTPVRCISIWLFCSTGIFRLPGCIPSLEVHH